MILREFGGGPCLPYIVRGIGLDLGDNWKVITDYKNLRIMHILTDFAISSGYPPDILREAPSRAVPRKDSSCGLGRPWGRSPCGLPWVSGVIPPQLVPERLAPIVQRRLQLVRAGANEAEQYRLMVRPP
jgi:hypothetical protein